MVAKPTLGSLVNPAHALATNILASYLFNEGSGTTAADSSGNGHGLTLNLTAIAWGSSGIFTSSPALICSATAGTTGGVPSGATVGWGSTWSLELWLTYQTSDSYATLVAGNTATHNPDPGLFLHNGKLDLYRVGDHDATTTLTAGNHYQVGVTYDGTSVRFYLNSTLDATVTVSLGSLFELDTIINDASSETFVGTYDVLRVWQNRILTGTEFGTLYTDPFAMYASDLPWLSPGVMRRGMLAPAQFVSAREMARASGWLAVFGAVVDDLAWLRPRHAVRAQEAPGSLVEPRHLPAGVLAALGITAQPWWLDGVNMGKGFDRG